MAMDFEEVKAIVLGNSLGDDVTFYDYSKGFLIKDDGVLTGREQIMFLINELMESYVDINESQRVDNYKIRDVLIKFANSKNAMRRDMTVEKIVDEFMENN